MSHLWHSYPKGSERECAFQADSRPPPHPAEPLRKLDRGEIECVVTGDGLVDDGAKLPVEFAADRRPNASEWHIIDESAEQPVPVAS